MKTVTFTDFRKKASTFLTEVEHGETIVLFRRGRPIAEIIPYSHREYKSPSWKRPCVRFQIKGKDLSTAILEERESYK